VEGNSRDVADAQAVQQVQDNPETFQPHTRALTHNNKTTAAKRPFFSHANRAFNSSNAQ